MNVILALSALEPYIPTFPAAAPVIIKKVEILALQCWTAVQTEPIVVSASIITWINDDRSCCVCNSDGPDWNTSLVCLSERVCEWDRSRSEWVTERKG